MPQKIRDVGNMHAACSALYAITQPLIRLTSAFNTLTKGDYLFGHQQSIIYEYIRYQLLLTAKEIKRTEMVFRLICSK